ncbi:helix-turn-helix domain-containing protein [Williamwhitmania taraxaci]|uniref:Helix-turn-helix n=1 Tax=Williamwhitmania taraxaci TaxID=1640674 RepID=A0A1G6HWG7_9BACT|nr:helix-turn-helix transcriptional regulator [Williamwhitmania taraxaci]SDB98657.1 Helix-turn-helix [Williamwhitmania taraxaci]
MEDRILKILTGNQLSATRFADIIGVQKSSISHILSGRNKPSFDFIEKVLIKFPDINPEWLILGKGNMYRTSIQTTLFESSVLQEKDESSSPEPTEPELADIPIEKQLISTKTDSLYPPVSAIKGKSIERVLIFYKDKTFSEYHPEE